jgi:hypothetical protein
MEARIHMCRTFHKNAACQLAKEQLFKHGDWDLLRPECGCPLAPVEVDSVESARVVDVGQSACDRGEQTAVWSRQQFTVHLCKVTHLFTEQCSKWGKQRQVVQGT